MIERAEAPKMTFVLEHEGPIPLAEFTVALQRLAARYARVARSLGEDDEPKLYIAEVRKGSLIVDFVTQHPGVTLMGGGLVAGVGAGNGLFAFARNLGDLVAHFTGKGGLTEVSKVDCDDMRALASPVLHTLNAQIIISINDGADDLVRLDEPSARIADNRAALERAALSHQAENVRSAVLLVWDQVRDAPGVEMGRSPDRAIVAELDARPRQVTFASDDIKERMGRRDFNPFEKAFVVDIKVLVGPNGPMGYRVLALHDVLDRE